MKNYTRLHDRKLYYDGISEYSSFMLDDVVSNIGLHPDKQVFNPPTTQIKQYNALVGKDRQIKSGICFFEQINREFIIPVEFKSINIIKYVIGLCDVEVDNIPQTLHRVRYDRIAHELASYKRHGLFDVLRMVAYITSTMDTKNVVYGVGRGSSTSSYVLYLLKAHDIDSVAYEIDFNDMIKD